MKKKMKKKMRGEEFLMETLGENILIKNGAFVDLMETK